MGIVSSIWSWEMDIAFPAKPLFLYKTGLYHLLVYKSSSVTLLFYFAVKGQI